MMNADDGNLRLSAQGSERRRAIGDLLVARARQRRTGRRVLAAAACLLVAGAAAITMRVSSIPTARSPEAPIATTRPKVHSAPSPVEQPAPSALVVRVITNDPLPSRNCGQSPSASGSVSVCLLDDKQLLSALSQTGESYGIVRIGGQTRVVSNSVTR
jgi:hypothetical protein